MYTLHKAKGDMLFDIINTGLLTVGVLLVIYPLYFIVIASISDPVSIYNGKTWFLPSEITFEGYQRIFDYDSIWISYMNTIIYTVVGTAINLIFTIPAAYALSRKTLDGKNIITLFITFTMFFGGGLIPTYLLISKLGMIDTIWALVIPNAVNVWNLIIARTFFNSSIPDELLDAAVIDGCSDFIFFRKIVLPLSQALIAVMILFYSVNHWNTFFDALIYLRSEKKYPLQLVLRSILIQNEISSAEIGSDSSAIKNQQRISDIIKYGVIIVASLPVLILYPVLQKYFVKGVMIGAIKG